MQKFFSYFFGQNTEKEFGYFSLAHIAPIIVMIGVIALIIKFRNKIKGYKHEERIRLALAFTLIITEMSYFWRLVGVESLNANPVDHLPITVCGWAIIFCSFLVLTKNQTLFDIVYFWVLAGSIFGILTPTVIIYTGPTRFRYYQFWLEHTLGFVTLAYMIFVHGMRPNIKSIIKSFFALLILGFIAILANTMLPGANYLFLATTEDAATILDILPKNYAVRVLLMGFVIACLFVIMYLPWLIMDIKRKKQALASNTPAEPSQKTIETNQDQPSQDKNLKSKKTSNKKKQATKD